MNVFDTKNRARLGNLLLLALTAPYAWILVAYLLPAADFRGGDATDISWTYVVWALSIMALLFAFFFYKKYPLPLGIVLIGLGVIAIYLIFQQPPVLGLGENAISSSFFLCAPTYLLTSIIGIYFLVRASVERKKSPNNLW